MLDRSLRWLARTVDAKPRGYSIACLILAALAAIVVVRIPVTTDILDVLPERNPAIAAFKDFLQDFGILDGLVIVVESEDRSIDSLIGTVQTLGERLSASPYVASVDYNLLRSNSRFVAEHFPVYLRASGITRLAQRLTPEGIRIQIRKDREALLSPLASPFEAEMIRLDPLNLRELVQESLVRRLPSKALDVSTGYYLDRSHRLALLMVRPQGSVRDMSFVRGLRGEVGRIASQAIQQAENPRGMKIGLAGGYARAAEALSVIWQDMVVSFAASLLLILLILYFAFRPSLLVLGIFVVAMFASLAWTLLLAYFLYGTLNIITSIVAAMLIGLFVDYMIQVYRRFEECYRLEGSPLQALERTLTGTGKAIVSGALTTALSFFSIVVTSFRGLHELGVVAGFGIIFCLLATLVLMASLLSWLARSRPRCLLAGRPVDFGVNWAARLVDRRGRTLVLGFSVLLALGFAGAMRLRFDTSVESMGVRHSAVQSVEEKIEQVLGRRGEPLFVVGRADGEDRLASDFDDLERQGERWRADGRVGSFSSLGMLLPPPYLQREALTRLSAEGLMGKISGPDLANTVRKEMDRQGMVADASLEAYATRIARALAEREVVSPQQFSQAQNPRAMYFYNSGRTAIAAHLTPPGPRWDRAGVLALAEDVRRLGKDFRLVGPAIFLDEIKTTILWEAGAAVMLTFAANLLIVWYHFRRWGRVWPVMLPVTAGTILTLGAMGILGMQFNFFNVAGIALIFGFGVDYGIYLMQADTEIGSGKASSAVRSTGGNIVLCAVTTMASSGSLITTHYRGLASVGAVLCLGALFCLVSTLLLLPALLASSRTVSSQP
ncbi:MAG TPA: MMPL family transporter [Candidatus Methylomirabilis sp.]|nr:MMPL family transporter [Candidatus Methylomirabilis sp.]